MRRVTLATPARGRGAAPLSYRHGPRVRRVVSVLLALALVLCPAAGGPALAADEAAGAPAALSGEAALDHVRYLAETIGPRPAGSAHEAAAAVYLAEVFTRLGYQTTIQPFTIETYEERRAGVAFLAPPGESIEAAALLYSAGGEATGLLVDAGLARREEWPPGSLAGRVALIERGEVPFAEKVDAVAAAGAVAAIIFNNRDGAFTGSLGGRSAIPAIALSRAAGLALRERLREEPLQVRVTVDADVVVRESRNVIAMRPGPQPGAVVVGGHFDSVPQGPGANDNASGTAVVLEVARYFAQRDYPYTLYFIAFGAEEIGLRGSRHFVDTLPEAERAAIRAMVNVDMVGVGDQVRAAGSDELIAAARAAAEALALSPPLATGSGTGGGSDHASFARVGVPVVFLHRSPDPNYHSPGDRAEHVDPAALALAARLVVAVLEHLATGP